MTLEEVQEFIEARKAEGDTEEDIVKVFYVMYANDKITEQDLESLLGAMGWEFTDEFKAMSDEDKKKDGIKKTTPIR